ncbi:LPS assembly lipoprotein LptE [Methylovirgula sp. 4M-Z18]|uniref:LPS assembly lipoprotein LptE n=1 Tax=Methylovirgula sp. 4M-Z18 TaxID=2293567 RepID=UPI000E2F8142|nr:LPS assembly lipoprotein LptE [Methylovirgula sp. 4M-Z18]RFB78033.1 hypothetical protein DYH55_18675 [Methylovirgula sp. 4M-Z18]
MSSFKRNQMSGLARGARFAALLLLATPLAGCFQPEFASTGPDGSPLVKELQAIKVDPIPDRVGHYLGNELIFALNGTGQAPEPKYHLLVTVRESVQVPLYNSFGGYAAAATVVLDADYKLLPAGGGAPVVTGTAKSSADYTRSNNRFANIRAARDAEIRNTKVLADQIRTRLAGALAQNTP